MSSWSKANQINFFWYFSADGPTSTYFSNQNYTSLNFDQISVLFILNIMIITTQVRGLGDAVYAVNCGGEAHTDLFGIKVLQTWLISIAQHI